MGGSLQPGNMYIRYLLWSMTGQIGVCQGLPVLLANLAAVPLSILNFATSTQRVCVAQFSLQVSA
jgi:hypothetical protein